MEKEIQMKLTLSILVLLFSLNSFASVDVVYGDDNRVDVYASNNQFYVDLNFFLLYL